MSQSLGYTYAGKDADTPPVWPPDPYPPDWPAGWDGQFDQLWSRDLLVQAFEDDWTWGTQPDRETLLTALQGTVFGAFRGVSHDALIPPAWTDPILSLDNSNACNYPDQCPACAVGDTRLMQSWHFASPVSHQSTKYANINVRRDVSPTAANCLHRLQTTVLHVDTTAYPYDTSVYPHAGVTLRLGMTGGEFKWGPTAADGGLDYVTRTCHKPWAPTEHFNVDENALVWWGEDSFHGLMILVQRDALPAGAAMGEQEADATPYMIARIPFKQFIVQAEQTAYMDIALPGCLGREFTVSFVVALDWAATTWQSVVSRVPWESPYENYETRCDYFARAEFFAYVDDPSVPMVIPGWEPHVPIFPVPYPPTFPPDVMPLPPEVDEDRKYILPPDTAEAHYNQARERDEGGGQTERDTAFTTASANFAHDALVMTGAQVAKTGYVYALRDRCRYLSAWGSGHEWRATLGRCAMYFDLSASWVDYVDKFYIDLTAPLGDYIYCSETTVDEYDETYAAARKLYFVAVQLSASESHTMADFLSAPKLGEVSIKTIKDGAHGNIDAGFARVELDMASYTADTFVLGILTDIQYDASLPTYANNGVNTTNPNIYIGSDVNGLAATGGLQCEMRFKLNFD